MRLLLALLVVAILATPSIACRITNDASRMCVHDEYWVVHSPNNPDTNYLMIMVTENTNWTVTPRVLPLNDRPGDVPIENASITLRPHLEPTSTDWPTLRTCYTDSGGVCIVDIPAGYKDKKFDIVVDYYDVQGDVRYTDTYEPEPGLPWYTWFLIGVPSVVAMYFAFKSLRAK